MKLVTRGKYWQPDKERERRAEAKRERKRQRRLSDVK